MRTRGGETVMQVRSKLDRFRRLVLPLFSVALAAAVIAPPATARSRHEVRLVLRDTIVQRSVSAEGVVNTTAGAFTGRPFADGAIVQRVRPTPLPEGGETTRATFTIFTKRGSLSGTGRSTRTPQPDGTVSVTASRTITGGTGAYKRATGRLRVRGTRSPEGISTARWRGYAIY
jgi:hypothetical protein